MPYGTILTDVIQSSTAGTPPQFNDGNSVQTGTLCRAWINYKGTATVSVRASFNVSSVTVNGTGDYTFSFTNAMPDANYSVQACMKANEAGSSVIGASIANQANSMLAGSVRIVTGYANNGVYVDGLVVAVAVFR